MNPIVGRIKLQVAQGRALDIGFSGFGVLIHMGGCQN